MANVTFIPYNDTRIEASNMFTVFSNIKSTNTGSLGQNITATSTKQSLKMMKLLRMVKLFFALGNNDNDYFDNYICNFIRSLI